MLLELLKLRRTYKNINRVRQIVNVFVKHGFGQFVEQLNLQKFLPLSKRLKIIKSGKHFGHTIPERLRLAFSELGPSFIKLAQLLASRPDLITKAYADEFKKLQDEVPPFDFSNVMDTIEKEMNTSVKKLFNSIEEKPIAAASIAQVHYAILKDGTPVVIKIQRPNISNIIETDISILKVISSMMVKYIPETEFFNPEGIVEEFSKTIKRELDFNEEAKNINRFRRNFAGHPHIYIPRLYPEYVSKKMLVMERIEGVRIDDIENIERLGHDRKKLAKIGIDAYFKMFLEDGFFHADPHPGNIFVMPDGKIGLVDFGIVGWLTPDIMESIATALIALVRRDIDTIVDQYIKLGLTKEDIDMEEFRREFKADMMDLLIPLYDVSISDINLAQYLDSLIHIAVKHKLKIPPNLLLLNKCMLILDSIGRELDPDFNFINVAEPYAKKLIKSRYHPYKIYESFQKHVGEFYDFTVTTPRQLNVLLKKAIHDEFHLKITPLGLDRLIKDIDRCTNRLAFSIVISAIILSSSILTLAGIKEKIFGTPLIGIIGFMVAFGVGFWLLISIIRSGRL